MTGLLKMLVLVPVLVATQLWAIADGSATNTSCPNPAIQYATFRPTACKLHQSSVDYWQDTFEVGSVARITCAFGYTGTDGVPVNDTATCQPDGRWLRAGGAECDRRMCGTIGKAEDVVFPFVQNGTETTVLENPWHVGIYRNLPDDDFYGHNCGGTILTRWIVISAAHCFYEDRTRQPAMNYEVVAGTSHKNWMEPNASNRPQNISVAFIHVHTDFKGSEGRLKGDVAVLVLTAALEFNRLVAPICMDYDLAHMATVLVPEAYGRVVGWGVTHPAHAYKSNRLMMVNIPIVDPIECKREMSQALAEYLTVDKFCSGRTKGTGVCFGDSGGGLVFGRRAAATEPQRFYLGGIVSNGPSCESAYNHFSNITHFHDLIFDAAREYLAEVRCARRAAVERLGASCTTARTDCAVMMRPGDRWTFDCRTALCGPDGEFVYLGQPCAVKATGASAALAVESCGGLVKENCGDWCDMSNELVAVCGDNGVLCLLEECG